MSYPWFRDMLQGDRLAWLIATSAGLGRVQLAPGTIASLVALFAAVAVHAVGGTGLFLAVGFVVAVGGLWSTARLWHRWNGDAGGGGTIAEFDPPEIVIDEICGQWIAITPVLIAVDCAGISMWQACLGGLAAFTAFRVFDIIKPGVIGTIDRTSGWYSIMADDMAAGLAAAATLAGAGLAAQFFITL